MEAENLKEISEENGLLNPSVADTHIFTQYIQDLYRFFKIHPFKGDFKDIFSLEWNLSENWLLKEILDNSKIFRDSAEFLFNKEHYADAAEIFLLLVDKVEDQAIYEKLAYCYQKNGNFKSAVEFYKRAELFEINRLWSLKKIIFCYRKLGDTESALNWSLQAAALEPEDAYLHTMLGNCYLDIQNYPLALEHYFKVEVLAPENKKVLRPIAWCCFVLGKLDLASSYMKMILSENPNANDLINAGHIELCLGNKPRAMEYYLSSIASGSINLDQFSKTLQFDTKHLLFNGIESSEIQLITDYIRFRRELN